MSATKIEYNCPPDFIGLPIGLSGTTRTGKDTPLATAFVRVAAISAVLPHHTGNPEHCNVFLHGDHQPMSVRTSVADVMHGIEVRGPR